MVLTYWVVFTHRNELMNFPEGLHDDQVDGASGAFRMLTNRAEVKIAWV